MAFFLVELREWSELAMRWLSLSLAESVLCVGSIWGV
jgi:hypothetical protein